MPKVFCCLIESFSSLDHQLQIIEDLGFMYADVTDSHSGGSLLDTIGMTASVSLDSNPMVLKRLFAKQISDHQQSVAPAPSRGLPHTPSSTGGR